MSAEYNAGVPRRSAVLAFCLLIVVFTNRSSSADGSAATLAVPEARELREAVSVLTAPEMAGRGSATPGGDRAAQRIAQWVGEAGLQPGGDGGSFLQWFPLTGGKELGAANTVEAPALGVALVAGRDFIPHGGSTNGDVTADVVFAGHGVSDPSEGYDDYAGVDVRGKVVLVLAGAPAHLRAPPASRLEKLIAGRDHGAAALLVADDALPSLDTTETPIPILSGTVTTAAADRLLASASTSVAARRGAIAVTARPASLATGIRARVRVALESAPRRTANVIGIVPGADPVRSRETVVIGAHYDHLGVVRGQVYPGADDNASGTAVVVGLARAFARLATVQPPARTLVFALFSGEEMGLLGSEHYVRQPVRPLAGTIAMLNFDQVGRLGDRRLDIGGVDSGDGLRRLVDDVTASAGVKTAPRGAPWAPSDHERFYAAGVPVVFFHTGTHPDYHAPTDTADRVDADGMATVARIGARLVERLANGPATPTYVSVPRQRPPARQSTDTGAFLGVAAHGAGELRIARVVNGSAAERAGMREGDVIVRMAGATIEGFEGLRSALRAYRAGDTVSLVYVRDGAIHDTSATLGER